MPGTFPMQQRLGSRNQYQYAINLLKVLYQDFRDVPLVLTIREPFDQYSDDQRKKFHAWMHELAEHTGHTDAEMKSYVMTEFVPPAIVRGKEVVRSFTELTKGDVSDLMNRVQAWAQTDLDLWLP